MDLPHEEKTMTKAASKRKPARKPARKPTKSKTPTTKAARAGHEVDRFASPGIDASKADKAADKAAEKARKEVEKRETAKAKAVEQKVTVKALLVTAKEVNVRLEKAKKSADMAIDHRLAASLLLATAKTRAATVGVSFKDWVSENITQGWETARKLAVIGASDNPRQELEGVRAANKEANKKLRDKSKVSRDTGPKAKAEPAGQIAMRGLSGMKADEKRALIHGEVSNLGMKMVDKEAPAPSAKTVEVGMKGIFNGLSAGAKMAFLKWAADEVGATVDFGLGSKPSTDEQEIPESLKR